MVFSRRKKLSRTEAGKTVRNAKDKTAARIDIAIRIVLGAYFAFAAGVYFTRAFAMLRQASGAQSGLEQVVDIFSILAIGFFVFFIACLYAIRLQPVSKFAGPVPAVTAVLGAFITYGLLLLKPRTDLPVSVKIIADCLILAGNIFSIFALRHLGRSFSILPEGRELVTSGPYRFIRHPLYLAEAFATIGAMICFLSPAAVALVGTQFLLQLARMHYEEKVLRTTFPDYVKYSRRTARLIPGIY